MGGGEKEIERERDVQVPLIHLEEPEANSYTFAEGYGGIAESGDTVSGGDITSCGLVLGFGSEKIAVYHWPFMSDLEKHYIKFDSLVKQVGDLKKIEIYTNMIPPGKEIEYEHTTEVISIKHRKRTVHYVTTGWNGDIRLLLGADGAKPLDRTVSQWKTFR